MEVYYRRCWLSSRPGVPSLQQLVCAVVRLGGWVHAWQLALKLGGVAHPSLLATVGLVVSGPLATIPPTTVNHMSIVRSPDHVAHSWLEVNRVRVTIAFVVVAVAALFITDTSRWRVSRPRAERFLIVGLSQAPETATSTSYTSTSSIAVKITGLLVSDERDVNMKVNGSDASFITLMARTGLNTLIATHRLLLNWLPQPPRMSPRGLIPHNATVPLLLLPPRLRAMPTRMQLPPGRGPPFRPRSTSLHLLLWVRLCWS